jgi:hypothetical protein
MDEQKLSKHLLIANDFLRKLNLTKWHKIKDLKIFYIRY